MLGSRGEIGNDHPEMAYTLLELALINAWYFAEDNAAVNLEVRVAYRDSDTDEWKELIAGDVYRNLNCRKPDKVCYTELFKGFRLC